MASEYPERWAAAWKEAAKSQLSTRMILSAAVELARDELIRMIEMNDRLFKEYVEAVGRLLDAGVTVEFLGERITNRTRFKQIMDEATDPKWNTPQTRIISELN